MIRLRLKIARLRRGFLKVKDAAEFIEKQGAIQLSDGRTAQARTYLSYEGGERSISAPILEQLEEAFHVQQRGWLQLGNRETEEQLRAELRRLEEEARGKALRSRYPALQDANSHASASVNQLTANSNIIDIKPSQFVPVRRIPVLSGDEIASFLAGDREQAMTGRAVTVPESINTNESCFGYVIPEHDVSMTGAGGVSFPPGTEAVFDADQDVLPDNFLLIRPRGMRGWLFRQYQAGLPLSVAKEYTLRALNMAVEPIRVTDPENWEVGGRLIATLHKW